MGRNYARPAMGDPTETSWPGEAEFCQACGTALDRTLVFGRSRGTCPACGRIDFRNPAVGVAVVLRDGDGRLLLVKRAPGMTQAGRWCVPAGYMDYGEDVREAAARELREETGLVAEVGEPLFVASNFHDPAKLSVGIWFEGRLTGGELQAGDDAVDAGWFALDELPDLAFETDEALIERMTAAKQPPPI